MQSDRIRNELMHLTHKSLQLQQFRRAIAPLHVSKSEPGSKISHYSYPVNSQRDMKNKRYGTLCVAFAGFCTGACLLSPNSFALEYYNPSSGLYHSKRKRKKEKKTKNSHMNKETSYYTIKK